MVITDVGIVSALSADNEVAKRYARWRPKGVRTPSGERITILTAKTSYAAGEPIRVVHVYEATKPGLDLHVMGPKPIDGESIDGVLVSSSRLPQAYNGLIRPSPGADFNFEITEHELAAGRHVFRWSPSALIGAGPGLVSNEIVVEVR